MTEGLRPPRSHHPGYSFEIAPRALVVGADCWICRVLVLMGYANFFRESADS